MSFSLRYDDHDQTLTVSGALTPQDPAELIPLREAFMAARAGARDVLTLNVKQLRRVNTLAFREFMAFARYTQESAPGLRIAIITSSMVAWSALKFAKLTQVNPNIAVELYDQNFYPGQEPLENGSFIPVLRAQTRLTWRHEQGLLPRHGLGDGMTVADICCGIGDFAVLLHHTFRPRHIVAVDHARSSLDYARGVAAQTGLRGIDYIQGDAAELLLDSDQFDFVTCRHSLQIFDRPELILRELFRICRPGGRVYITNEKISHCVGEPDGAAIAWTYQTLSRMFGELGMDLECGPRNHQVLHQAGFEDIREDHFMVSSRDGDPQDFADMVTAWEEAFAGDMCQRRGDAPDFVARFRQGFEAHSRAALSPSGYAGWPIFVASGRKPA